MFSLVWLIPVMPLLGAIINGVFGSRTGKKAVGLVGCIAMAISFAISVSIFVSLISLPPESRSIVVTTFDWIPSGFFHITFNFLIDPLSTLMILVVTGVGFLIHVYSVGYMHHDEGFWRYFAYLNLFVFFMLMLVLGANYIVMYLGWEGVGLSSYLLIGFWYEKKSASDAGKKAFVVNRFGDFGFALGVFLLFWTLSSHGVHTLDYTEVFKHANLIDHKLITIITCLLFVGAVGKSAQFPLYVWLPDAMEGPTPVSALIHAATMVTAGVYMVARNNVLFSLAPFTGQLVASVGVFTAFLAATIGLVQNDIKKVLAYSTVSQLGYMFVGVGLGAYAGGVFHLMTHAFFKGLLFLGSGSVIHAMSGEQDMTKMGGLYGRLKTTSITFIIAALAISGIPPFSGFWSKDEILGAAFSKGHYIIWAVGLFTAFLTAFYMFRQVFMTFTGECRADEHTKHHIHESPAVMTIPLIILAFLAAVGGLIGMPFFAGGSPFHNYLAPVFEHGAAAVKAAGESGVSGTEYILMLVSVAAGISGIALAAMAYYEPWRERRPAYLDPEAVSQRFNGIYTLLYNKYYVDEIYGAILVNPAKRLAGACLTFDLKFIDWLVNGAAWLTRFISWVSHKFDIYVVDGLINSLATLVEYSSGMWRRLQTGYLQNYALIFILGVIILIGRILLG